MSRSSIATDGPWKNCSTESPSVATRDVSRTFSAPSAAVHWFGPAPTSSSRARRRLDAELAGERRLDRRRHVLEARRAPRPSAPRELRQPHQRAEVAGRERGASLRLDRLHVDPRRAAAADDDARPDAVGPQRSRDLRREPLRVPVAEDEDGVALRARQAVERRVHRLHRPRVDARLPQQPDARGSRRASSSRCRRPATRRPRKPPRLPLDRLRIGEQAAQFGRLAPDRRAHDARHSLGLAAARPPPPPGRVELTPRRTLSRAPGP